MPDTNTALPASSWVALRYPAFRQIYISQFVLNIGAAMQLAAVNWHVWTLTKDELALGLVGLARVLPIVVLALLGGVIADASDRRRLLIRANTTTLLFVGALALITLAGGEALGLLYVITALLAGISAFESPARSALLPKLVPPEHLAHAVRVNTLAWPVTAVLGPVCAGIVLSVAGPGAAYALSALATLPAILILSRLRGLSTGGQLRRQDINLGALREGLSFVWRMPQLRSTMLLDFFATFFSSALALLPIYATDILHVGATGYGVLSAAPSAGSILGALLMTQLGARVRRQGRIMLIAVGAYGVATVVFGLSQHFILSLVALALVGFSDAVSMVIRATMRQLLTPDRLRGRMISVNMIFFQGGPQLGEFEAGALARVTSAVFSVVSGGVATVIFVGLVWLTVPALRNYREGSLPPADEPSAVPPAMPAAPPAESIAEAIDGVEPRPSAV
ncbi:MAG: MFS transporter [Anaerolineae bacterium]|nr:MFS transporter [Anaerolineae bacterium]